MKYSINFYLDELKPKVYYLTLRNTALAVLACALVFIGWKLVLDNDIKQNKRRVQLVQQQVTDAQANLERLQADLVKHNDKATFNQRKQRLQQTLDAKLMLWEGVGKGLEAATVNYHDVLDQLTKFHEENIWLSSFEVNEGAIVFKGYALESSAVTRWMTKLQSSSAFKGREFSHISMKAQDDNSLAFVVATEADSSLPVLVSSGTNPLDTVAVETTPQLPEVPVNE